MIIKSMSRKEPSFNQLLDYMESGRADGRFTILHNLYGRTPDQIKEEFSKNAKLLRRRAGGNFMYHEVISISRSDKLELDEQKEKLRQITLDYVRERAQNNLAYGALHDDHENNIHFHLIISANEVHSQNRHRLSKKEFDGIKKGLEKRVLEHYPELQQKELINRTSTEHVSKNGGELKRRTGKTPQRDRVRRKVEDVLKQAETREDLLNGFEREGLDFYIRGKNPGVMDRKTGRKYRIKTLGFLAQFNEVNRKIEADLKHKMHQADKRSEKLSDEEKRDQLRRDQMENRRAGSHKSTGKGDGQKR